MKGAEQGQSVVNLRADPEIAPEQGLKRPLDQPIPLPLVADQSARVAAKIGRVTKDGPRRGHDLFL
jgi:hypothetical protein